MDKRKKERINRLITEANGTIVTVGAHKKTKDGKKMKAGTPVEEGDFRKFNCRLGVDMNNGGELKYVPDEKDLLLVFDMQKLVPRMVNLPGVKWVKVKGVTHNF